MLTKHPIVVETMKRLRRYVGNTKNWGFTDEQKEEFDEKAAKVRNLAESIYDSFKVSFFFSGFSLFCCAVVGLNNAMLFVSEFIRRTGRPSIFRYI